MAARVSVVVPIYNVAPYLEKCLQSIAAQTLRDIEVVMVEDGSTDDSPSIAEAFSERDPRFRLVRQANAGLGAARNTGIEHATGEFLVFADSDDAVPRDAYELMLSTLDETGSDFVTGKTMRFTAFGSAQKSFQGPVFKRTRLRTHITRFPLLRVDRTAWNKLFRRSFWDEHGFRFPEGVYYEDTPVMLPAHYVATSVDVLEEPVYLWRTREGSDLSITQKRTELKSLRDRVSAVDHVSRFLAERNMKLSKALYDRAVLRNDLRFFLMVLPSVGDDYRKLFLELVNDFLDRSHPSTLEQPFAIDRLKWQLVRRNAMPELLEVLRFEADELAERAPLRRGRHWYGDYPCRGDERLALPDSVFRLTGDELAPVVCVEEMRCEGDSLRLKGYAYIDLVGAPLPGSQRLQITAVRSGFPPKRVALAIEEEHRPDLTPTMAQQLVSLEHAGFVATLDIAELRRGAEWRPGSWELRIVIKAEGLLRRTTRFDHGPLCPVPPADLAPAHGVRVRAALGRDGDLQVRVTHERPLVPTVRVDDGVAELEGELKRAARGPVSLQVAAEGETPRSYPAHVDRSRARPAFLARVPLSHLGGDPSLHLVNGTGRIPLRLPEAQLEGIGPGPTSVITDAEFSPNGRLRLSGTVGSERADGQLVVVGLGLPETLAVPFEAGDDGRFTVELSPGALTTARGTRLLRVGTYELLLGPVGAPRAEAAAPRVSRDLLGRLPVSGVAGRKRFYVGVWQQGPLVLAAERDLDDDERGGVAQRNLRNSHYVRARTGELRNAVLYESFGGRELADSPRAIYEELVGRRAPLEHLWVVDDGAFAVPGEAIAVRKGSREYYEAYARARYLVTNDHWPKWFRRRQDQVALQTWHGAPLKFQGRELSARPFAFREHRRALGMESWDVVVSPGDFATPILERGYDIGGEVLETGLPRTDLLLGAGAAARRAEVRHELGLADERVILYAPTYRDDLDYSVGNRPRLPRDDPTYRSGLSYRQGYRLAKPLDLAALAAGLGEGHTLLFYRHPRIMDTTPAAVTAAARDVSWYSDPLELLLAADVLVTDYSSWLFDFAATGRPIVVFAPDIERYRDEVRGLHIDLEADGPGPVARTVDEVLAALRDSEAWTERREVFVNRYCALADGRAAGRLIEQVFSS